MQDPADLNEVCRLLRYQIINSTTVAKSGHPTSSLSAVELMTGLFGSGLFRYDVLNPKNLYNDKLIFSKGHAAPLYYALWSVVGGLDSNELINLRKFGSILEGHPTMRFPHTIAATGSLGQGLSVGVGMAINAKYLDKVDYNTYVLLGDGEVAEGSIWEAAEIASKYNLDNLTAIIDVNRLDQVGETLHGWDLEAYGKKFDAFGWESILLEDGHDINLVMQAYQAASTVNDKPTVIIAKTNKGHGVSFLQNYESWHGKALTQVQADEAFEEIGEADLSLRFELPKPNKNENIDSAIKSEEVMDSEYKIGELVEPRDSYGLALGKVMENEVKIIAIDAGMNNSTRSKVAKDRYQDRFFEMYIAEQNMVGVALGLSKVGKKPFVSTFAAFFSRALDQVRMAQYSEANISFIGSHVGVSIGKDGSSQMGLEDIAMFRAIQNSIVLYPSDATSMERCVQLSANYIGLSYIRSTRMALPVLYDGDGEFKVGGSHTVFSSEQDLVTVVGAGVTLHEAIKAYDILKEDGIKIRVIDLYSIKPLDIATLLKAVDETKAIITVEDHYAAGGIGEAVSSKLSTVGAKVYKLCVNEIPISGKPYELIEYMGIDSLSIVEQVKDIIDETE